MNWPLKNHKTYPCFIGSDGTPRRRKFLTLDQKIEIVQCHEAGMKTSAIARERGMNESSVRCIVKRKDQIKELIDRTSHLSPTVVRNRDMYLHSSEIRGLRST